MREPRQGRTLLAGWGWEIGFLCALGLLALGWFHRGFLIKTEDVALPFTPARWWQYAHAWNNLIDAGIQFWENFPGLVFLALPAALQGLGLSMPIAQRLEYLVWFTLPGLSMYLLMRQVAPGPSGRMARLVASTFYMCNLYLEPVWQGLNIANLSAYVAVPALLGLLMVGLDRDGDWRTIPAMALVSLIGAGIGTNPPLMLVAAIPLPLYVCFDVMSKRRWRRPRELWRIVRYLGGSILAMAVVNSFWLLPQLAMMWGGGGTSSTIDQATSLEISRSWLQGASAATNLLNVLRLQGHWVWYDPIAYVPYAHAFQTSAWLLTASFLLPGLIWAGLLSRIRPLDLFFAGLAIVGLLFGIGVHPPFGGLYNWMVGHVPLFWIIRSPWYKFTLLTCVGYAVLLGGCAERISSWVAKRLSRRSHRRVMGAGFATAIPLSIIGLTLAYAFPVSLGKMYPTSEERQVLSSSHIQIPPYVHQTAEWVNQQPDIRRLLVLPSRHVYSMTWGYADYMPALTYFTSKPLVFDYPRSGWQPGGTSQIVSVIKKTLRDGVTRNVQDVLALLNVDAILVEHDAVTAWRVDYSDQPEQLTRRLENQLGIVPAKTFGPWVLYRVTHQRPFVYEADHVTLVVGDQEALPRLANADLLQASVAVFASQQTASTLDALLRQGFVHHLVCFNAPLHTLHSAVSPFVNQPAMDLLYTSDHMETVFSPYPSGTCRISALEGFSPPEVFQGKPWRWLLTNYQPNVIVDNSASSWRYANMRFQVYALDRSRSLYTYLNGALVNIQPVPANGAVDVRLPRLRFHAGRNIVSFYSPEQHDFHEGRPANFALREFVVDAAVIAQVVDIPLAGTYRMSWYLESPLEERGESLADAVGIDTQPVRLKMATVAGRPIFVSDPIALAKGTHRVWCEPLIGTKLSLRLSLVQTTSLSDGAGVRAVACRSVSPTKYLLSYLPARPALLVFSEGFHPRWWLRLGRGAPQTPIVVNGFANGYFIFPTSQRGSGSLEFMPQRWFVVGAAVSCLALATCLLGWVFVRQRNREKPHVLR